MPKVFTSKTQQTGEIGENIAVKFLVKHGYSILERNYTKKWGEIDVIAQKEGKLYFVEVKSVSRLTLPSFVTRETSENNVIHETNDEYRPEDNMHPWKLKRLSRTIQTYLASSKASEDLEWQVDLLVVYLNLKDKKAKVKVIKDIIL
ncbi:MAG: YraN family protein [Candidatus Nomurabacteria bacterium]|nr:YraN family protein [Candidatus Nomurabacteria bacterium]